MTDNSTPLGILKNLLMSTAGLVLFAFGVYLTIQANIGVSPWDIFQLGLSSTLGVSYGTVSIAVSVAIVIIDILLKEKIGISMILDAVIVGKSVDLFNYLAIVPLQTNLWLGILILIIGLIIDGFAQYLYIKAGLGAGPRDTLLVGLHRRFSSVPIGVVSIMILIVPTVAGYFLGGPVGIGTILCVLLTGPIMQYEFKLLSFEPTRVNNQSLSDSFKILFCVNSAS